MSTLAKHLHGLLTSFPRKRLIIAKGKVIERWPRKATGLTARQGRMAAGLPVEHRHSELVRLGTLTFLRNSRPAHMEERHHHGMEGRVFSRHP
jgi:hypothetical protein